MLAEARSGLVVFAKSINLGPPFAGLGARQNED